MPLKLYLLVGLAYSCFFCTDILIRKYSVNANSFSFILKRSAYTVLLSFAVLVGSLTILTPPSGLVALQIIGISIICGMGLWFFILANRLISFPNVVVINLFGLLVQQLAARFILGEHFSPYFYPSLAICIVGLLVQASVPKLQKGLVLALLSITCWSFGYSLLSIPLKYTAVTWSAFIMESTILFSAWLIYKLTRKDADQKVEKSPIKPLNFMIIAVLTTMGSLLIKQSYKEFQVGEISLLYLFLFPFSLLVSKWYFKEEISKREWLGTCIIFIGIALFVIR
ncbi:MAG: DMT family transporter [Sphingobacteriales bacterium]|jgi:drug/metabolite transporter (DMT)-like permease|nr:DMT family transporter [Sphingobacteriales bacterium]